MMSFSKKDNADYKIDDEGKVSRFLTFTTGFPGSYTPPTLEERAKVNLLCTFWLWLSSPTNSYSIIRPRPVASAIRFIKTLSIYRIIAVRFMDTRDPPIRSQKDNGLTAARRGGTLLPCSSRAPLPSRLGRLGITGYSPINCRYVRSMTEDSVRSSIG